VTPSALVAWLVLFVAVGGLFLMVALWLGRLLRPSAPNPAKLEPYECGEPPIGSTVVRFDLRFYVVALVFIVFEVEVSLFFPPATVFGKATRLMDPRTPPAAKAVLQEELGMAAPAGLREELGMASPGAIGVALPPAREGRETAIGPALDEVLRQVESETTADARRLAVAAMADLGVFFAVILLGFAYVWQRGDLEWVRVIGSGRPDGPGRDRRVLG